MTFAEYQNLCLAIGTIVIVLVCAGLLLFVSVAIGLAIRNRIEARKRGQCPFCLGSGKKP